MGKKNALSKVTQEPRKIIVLTEGPPTIHRLDDKSDDSTIHVYLTGDDRIQAVAYSNCSFFSTHGRKAEYVGKNPECYQAANFGNETGEIKRDYWPFIRDLVKG